MLLISFDFEANWGDFGLSDSEISYAASFVGFAAVLASGISCLSDRYATGGGTSNSNLIPYSAEGFGWGDGPS